MLQVSLANSADGCRCCWLQVLLNVVKEAPGACVPHLQPLVGRIHSLWEQGQLREGEKVAMYEGVMAAAAAGGPELQVGMRDLPNPARLLPTSVLGLISIWQVSVC